MAILIPQTSDYIVKWLASYCESAGQKGFVVGVSGGIDSALTSMLCALSGLPVWCMEMPIHQKEDQVTRAKQHIQWLRSKYPNASYISTSLTEVFDQMKSILPRDDNASKASIELALANTRSRLRMTTLYYVAGIKNALVVGTGNKVEDFGIGFFTKYGDGGVDVSPIADLTKTEVFRMAKALGVHESILEAPPTDGLWEDDRTDEKQIGATYAELEQAMRFIENPTQGEGELTPRQREVLGIYRGFHSRNAHKMRPIPVCVIPDGLRERE